MVANTKIEWARHTWNPWIGCTEVSPACDHCYARAMMDTRLGRVKWGPGEPRVQTSQANWDKVLHWDVAARAAGRRDTVFCLSLGDIWDNEVDGLTRFNAFYQMRQCENLIFLLLSKRIGNAVAMAKDAGGLPENAALGSTMVDGFEWRRDSGKLEHAARELGALFTFASVEPMLGVITMGDYCPDWVICGGESGPSARLMQEDWAGHLMVQTVTRGKAFFMKQMTGKAPIPAGLMVREYPKELV